jgi:hypothetical protein
VSVSRLIIGIFWLGLSVFTFRWRRRVRAGRASGVRGPWRVSGFLLGLGVLYALLGLLWLDLAFN